MAKTMAVVTDGIVTNMIWCKASQADTDTLKDFGDCPAGIGDTYENGKFYRDGEMILTPLEEARKKIAELEAAYLEGVNSV